MARASSASRLAMGCATWVGQTRESKSCNDSFITEQQAVHWRARASSASCLALSCASNAARPGARAASASAGAAGRVSGLPEGAGGAGGACAGAGAATKTVARWRFSASAAWRAACSWSACAPRQRLGRRGSYPARHHSCRHAVRACCCRRATAARAQPRPSCAALATATPPPHSCAGALAYDRRLNATTASCVPPSMYEHKCTCSATQATRAHGCVSAPARAAPYCAAGMAPAAWARARWARARAPARASSAAPAPRGRAPAAARRAPGRPAARPPRAAPRRAPEQAMTESAGSSPVRA